MKASNLTPDDLDKLRAIHEQYYKDEFGFPDFLKAFFCSFKLEDEQGIICAGGVRFLAEIVMLTDKSRTIFDRRMALAQSLEISEYFTRQAGLNELHAFIQDPLWYKRLIKQGFHTTKGKALVLEL